MRLAKKCNCIIVTFIRPFLSNFGVLGNMKITILGNNSALPAFGRHPTAQTVTINGEVILIDCGEGTQIQMQRYGIKWRKLHYILISHLHGDHYFGLPGLINSMSLMGRTEPLHLYAPASLEGILDQILGVADTTLSFPLHFHALPEGQEVLADVYSFRITCFPVVHRIACHGFLIEGKNRGRKILPEVCEQFAIPTTFYLNLKNGEDYVTESGERIPNEQVTLPGPEPRRYAFCADTIFTKSYLDVIKGVDAIYHESTYLEEDKDKAESRYHCTARQAALIAKAAKTKLLLLGHFSSKYKDLDAFYTEATEVFEHVVVTEEGKGYDL